MSEKYYTDSGMYLIPEEVVADTHTAVYCPKRGDSWEPRDLCPDWKPIPKG
jgi:hypothetical protein